MANFTGKAIKATFIELLEEKPISDITVKDIVERCGINRNSFYYHFQDIPSLLEDIVKEEAQSIIEKYPHVDSMTQCFDAMTEFATSHKRALMHCYKSVNREVFEFHLMSVSEYLVTVFVNSVVNESKISEADKKAIINYFKCVCFGLTIDLLNGGIAQEKVEAIHRVLDLKIDLHEEFAHLFNS